MVGLSGIQMLLGCLGPGPPTRKPYSPNDSILSVTNNKIASERSSMRSDLAPNVLPPDVACVVILLKSVQKFD